MTESSCPVCGGWPAYEPGPGFAGCGGCGLVWQAEKHSAEPAYAAGTEADIYGASKRRLFAFSLGFLNRQFAAKGKLLDVGSAYGDFLTAAKSAGWDPEGVEIAPGPARAAVKRGFAVHTRPVTELSLPENSYGAVTAFEVFSQMADPLAASAELHRILRPGGIVVIREFNAAFHVFMRALEQKGLLAGLRPSVMHGFNFTAASLRCMLGKAGFRDIKVRNSLPTSGDPYRTGGRFGRFLTGAIKFLYYYLAQALWIVTFGRVLAGSALIITARK
ncbi:MAG: hypothetical protein A2285_02780 [Elusimicrobia bacterium RIFOXYA12_FULL_57_11]|nr:MAG: hypothetical protein A2285_02780 [Elusimicrobia bacterium RIFOXYA12_FULL_57_11]